jgi:hypothetical protein
MADGSRRFPAPCDANGQPLAYVYSHDDPAEARQAKVLTKDEARRIARTIDGARDALPRAGQVEAQRRRFKTKDQGVSAARPSVANRRQGVTTASSRASARRLKLGRHLHHSVRTYRKIMTVVISCTAAPGV